MRTTIRTVLAGFLVGCLFSQSSIACNSHPPEVSHSEWAWMQNFRDQKSGKVETQGKDFFDSKPRQEPEANQAAPRERNSRPIRYVR